MPSASRQHAFRSIVVQGSNRCQKAPSTYSTSGPYFPPLVSLLKAFTVTFSTESFKFKGRLRHHILSALAFIRPFEISFVQVKTRRSHAEITKQEQPWDDKQVGGNHSSHGLWDIDLGANNPWNQTKAPLIIP